MFYQDHLCLCTSDPAGPSMMTKMVPRTIYAWTIYVVTGAVEALQRMNYLIQHGI